MDRELLVGREPLERSAQNVAVGHPLGGVRDRGPVTTSVGSGSRIRSLSRSFAMFAATR